jgi:hypothetical protein
MDSIEHPHNDCILYKYRTLVSEEFQKWLNSSENVNVSIDAREKAYYDAVNVVDNQQPELSKKYNDLEYDIKTFGCSHYHLDEFAVLSPEEATEAMNKIHSEYLAKKDSIESEYAKNMLSLDEEFKHIFDNVAFNSFFIKNEKVELTPLSLDMNN